ncbi:glucan endo-1,3-beta-glucosidase A1 [Lachnospiraceae bacterium]|nr:glucan endo-1,3-beta-glucosidase A1 [Lachnospiraceae bacterium]
MEWIPGKISWYVDGKLIHTENDWYSATEGQGEISYPAPFDQPFYMILNLAVGGSWPGNPDETTDIANSAFYVDYVKAYQKSSYDENVDKPVKDVVLREPDANGNYVINGDFAVQEDLTDGKDWSFLTALGGKGTAAIQNNEITIAAEEAGTADYSIQLVQPNLPMKKGGVYQLSFDASAESARTMKVDVSAPDRSYRRYLNDTVVELTTEKKTYSYEFTMKDSDDANGRLEFNMGGAESTAGIKISNVVLKKTKEIDITEDKKGILADGNYVYNGSFQEGQGRLGYWTVTGNQGSEVRVTNEDNIRRLMIKAPEGTTAENPVIVSQEELALTGGQTYALSFTAEGEAGKSVSLIAAGQNFEFPMTGEEKKYSDKLVLGQELPDTNLAFYIKEPGVFYIDDVRIEEDSLIKNGSFNAGFAGYEAYVDSSADASYVVDSLTEDNAADFTINNTGDAAWKIQLKQNNIELEKDQWYKLTLDAKSSLARKLMFAIQRDGTSDDDWTPYSGEKIVELENGYNTYEIQFQMKNPSDSKAVLSISMGAVGDVQITEKHRICIDNINLEKIEAPAVPEKPAGENLMVNGDFASGEDGWVKAVTAPGEAEVSFAENKAVYHIENVGTEDWNVQLKQEGITLEQGKKYRITFRAASTKARTIKLAMLSQSYTWYGGEDILLEENQEKEVAVEFTMGEETDSAATLVVSMGLIKDGEGNEVSTPASEITLSDFSLVKVE